jgi:hypothetical protein
MTGRAKWWFAPVEGVANLAMKSLVTTDISTRRSLPSAAI